MLINLYVLLNRQFSIQNDKISLTSYNDEYIIAAEKDSKIYIIKYNNGVYGPSHFIIDGFNPYLIYNNEFGYFTLTFTWNDKIQRLDFTYGEIGTTSFSPLNTWDGYEFSGDGISSQSNIKNLQTFNLPEDWAAFKPTITGFNAADVNRLEWNHLTFYDIFTNIRYKIYKDGVLLGETTNNYFEYPLEGFTLYQVIGLADLKYPNVIKTYESNITSLETQALLYDFYNVSLDGHSTKIKDILDYSYEAESFTKDGETSSLSFGGYNNTINNIIVYDYVPTSVSVGYKNSDTDTKETATLLFGNFYKIKTQNMLIIESFDFLPTIFR